MSNPEPQFYLGISGQQSGPFPESEIRSRLAQHQLRGTDLCWQVGWEAWKPLATVFPSADPLHANHAPPPFESPVSGISPPTVQRVFIEGSTLVVPKDAPFPPICIRTGTTENLVAKPLKRDLSWHSPVIYIAVLLSILIYIILALIFRKKSSHLVYLSSAARSAQVKWHIGNWALFVGSLAAIFTAIARENGALGIMGAAGLIGCIVIYFLKVRILYATKIDGSHARIGGIPREVMLKLVANWP